MPTLLLLRHAKAEAYAPSDHERPLAARGVKQARSVGAYLVDEGLVPDLVFCSAALRTRETWAEIERALEGQPDVRFFDELYEADLDTVRELLAAHAGGAQRVLVVGHEPIMSMTAYAYAGRDSDQAAISGVWAGMPTASMAQISLAQWHDSTGTLLELVRPADS